MTTEFFINHLWQSSCFALLAGLLAFALRKSQPKVRYWIWLSASLKFLLPLALLMSLGSVLPRLAPRAAPSAASDAAPVFANTLAQIAEPFVPDSYVAASAQAPARWVPIAIGIVWVFGFVAIAVVRCRSWLRVRAALRAGTSVKLPISVPAVIVPGAEEPGVVGLLQPVLVLPARLLEHLNDRELEAILAHELCHARRRDNFFAAIHMLVEAIFWFHPLVWWIGSRMLEEREMACDEEVLRLGCEPTDYVEGILKVCRFYTESPLPCVSGVTGADVKRRLRAILAGNVARELSAGRKLVLVAIGLATLATPILIGMLNAPRVQAQSAAQSQPPAVDRPLQAAPAGPMLAQVGAPPAARQPVQPAPAPPQFEVVSIRPADPGAAPGSIMIRQLSRGVMDVTYPLPLLIQLAFGAQPYEITGAPAWVASARYEVSAKAGEPLPPSQMWPMLLPVLEDRFQMKVHREPKEMAVYELSISKSGKLPEPKAGGCFVEDANNPLPLPVRVPRGTHPVMPCGDTSIVGAAGGGLNIFGGKISMANLAAGLTGELGRPVLDKTGFNGAFDVDLKFAIDDSVPGYPRKFAAEPADPSSPPNILTALQDQLGLKLKAAKDPVEVIVIDRIERPSEN